MNQFGRSFRFKAVILLILAVIGGTVAGPAEDIEKEAQEAGKLLEKIPALINELQVESVSKVDGGREDDKTPPQAAPNGFEQNGAQFKEMAEALKGVPKEKQAQATKEILEALKTFRKPLKEMTRNLLNSLFQAIKEGNDSPTEQQTETNAQQQGEGSGTTEAQSLMNDDDNQCPRDPIGDIDKYIKETEHIMEELGQEKTTARHRRKRALSTISPKEHLIHRAIKFICFAPFNIIYIACCLFGMGLQMAGGRAYYAVSAHSDAVFWKAIPYVIELFGRILEVLGFVFKHIPFMHFSIHKRDSWGEPIKGYTKRYYLFTSSESHEAFDREHKRLLTVLQGWILKDKEHERLKDIKWMDLFA